MWYFQRCLFNFIIYSILISVSINIINCNNIDISSYSKVTTNTKSIDNREPKITVHKSPTEDTANFWYPSIFNKSTSTVQPSNEDTSTGRRYSSSNDNSREYPFPLLHVNPVYNGVHSKPATTNLKNHRIDGGGVGKMYSTTNSNNNNNHNNNRSPHLIYPVNSSPVFNDKSSGIKVAMDRYSPSEAFAFSKLIKGGDNKQQSNNNGYNYDPPRPPPSPPASKQPQQQVLSDQAMGPTAPTAPTYQPPNNLYSFPPINSNYGPPGTGGNIEDAVSSYLPPAAGPASDNLSPSSYSGPINPDYFPSMFNPPENSQESGGAASGDMLSGDSVGVMDSKDQPSEESPPPPPPDDHHHDHDHDHDHHHDDDHHDDHDDEHNHPPGPPPPADDHSHEFVLPSSGEHDDHSHEFELPPQPPPSISSDDHDHDFPYGSHELDFPSDHDYKYSGGHGIDAYPEIIYDHDPHHHHHYEPPPPPTTTTTTPEPPSEPRVKQYSYYYIGRKLWYIPLYFTVWFTFYITYLILQSIGRHKVDLPNHLTARRSIRDLSHKETCDKVDRLTVFVMTQMEDFRTKYL